MMVLRTKNQKLVTDKKHEDVEKASLEVENPRGSTIDIVCCSLCCVFDYHCVLRSIIVVVACFMTIFVV